MTSCINKSNYCMTLSKISTEVWALMPGPDVYAWCLYVCFGVCVHVHILLGTQISTKRKIQDQINSYHFLSFVLFLPEKQQHSVHRDLCIVLTTRQNTENRQVKIDPQNVAAKFIY